MMDISSSHKFSLEIIQPLTEARKYTVLMEKNTLEAATRAFKNLGIQFQEAKFMFAGIELNTNELFSMYLTYIEERDPFNVVFYEGDQESRPVMMSKFFPNSH